ncbi:Hemolysin III [hydrothermal vent metagenome]|uniref:Hemolysin III n=1 Tax=hydrothermal vent metagenome TaxID=652676 RepID=A0A1W1CSD2_9ZZZZ
MSNNVNDFALIEEIWNAVTHGIGFALSIAALVLLVVFAVMHGHGALHVTAAAIYGSSLMVLYGSSTLYHALTHHKAKHIFHIFDHASIYVLIAGSYTPIALITIGGASGWVLFGLEWGIAAVGIALKFIYTGRFELLSLSAYLVMGWLIVLDFSTFKAHIDPIGFWLVVAGGLAYSSGVVFYVKDNIRHFHSIWHLFVMTGSILHFFAILFYVV